MEIAGYIASIFIGIALGLIGGGGSILTVPVLVYLFQVDALVATAYSLFIVGLSSAVGSLNYQKQGLVNIKVAITFGLPSIAVIFLTRAFIVPAIPEVLLHIGTFTLSKSIFFMLLFALLMFLSAYRMITKSNQPTTAQDSQPKSRSALLLLYGIAVGLVTGLIGAGGGFLIIPALVSIVRLPMKNAVGTSLLIIAVNSLLGFVFSLPHLRVQWGFLLSVSALAITGIFIGTYLSRGIDGKKLQPAFGWFILIMGTFIVLKELFLS